MDGTQAHAALDQVAQAVRRATAPASGLPGEGNGEETLRALAALHELRAHLLAWEPTLIEAAREQGVSWAGLAPVLGVGTRQAAERRYLRLRPSQAQGLTREERVRATRDERAGDRAVAAWARANASELRRIAGQVSSVSGLTRSGRRRARTLATSLTDDDPTSLLEPLADMHTDLAADHTGLAEQVDEVGRQVRRVRRETQRRRGTAAQS